jgi:hypothetical protein
MDDVDNLGQVRKVAIVVVALFLVHMGAMIEKALSEGNKAIKENIRIRCLGSSLWITRWLYLASQQFGIEATSILALFGAWASDSASFAGTFTDISASVMVFAEGKYKLEIQYVWARVERS